MKITDYILTILLMLSSSIFSQENVDEEFIDSLNYISFDLAYADPDSALKVTLFTVEKSQEIGYPKGEITAYMRTGMVYEINGARYDTALYYYALAENCYLEKGEDIDDLIKVYIYQAGIYDNTGDQDLGLEKNQEVYDLAKQDSNSLFMGMSLLNISNILIDKADYTIALNLLHEAESLFSIEHPQERGTVYLNYGNIYQLQERYEEAIAHFKMASEQFTIADNSYLLAKSLLSLGNNYLHIESLDTALLYYNYTYAISANKFESINGLVYHNKGGLFQKKEQLDSAQYFYEKSLAIKLNNGDVEGLIMTYQNLGEILLIKDDPEGANDYFILAYDLAKEQGNIAQLEKLTTKLANCALKMNDIALSRHFLGLSIAYKDTLSDKVSESLIYEINYNKEKHKVSELESDLENKKLELNNQSNLIWFIFLFSAAGFVILIILYRLSKQRRKSLQIEKQHLEAEQKISELINSQEKEAMSAMYDGQEKEKNRIASELHDKLGAILSTVKLYFKSIDGQINVLKEENIQQYHKASDLLDEACDETRKIAHQLSSKNLGRIGLFSTVKMFQERIQDSGQLNFDLTTHGSDEDLEGLNQISIYRIIQELVNNILKHAHATEISLQLNVFDDIFNLVLEDDGIGFDINILIDNHGMGLKETEVRIKNMNGTIVIDSGRGGGTTITIDIPINKDK